MSGYPRLDETGLNTLTEALADATKQQGIIKVCETEAEWDLKSQAEKDDPNIYWFLPWRTETSGEIDDSTTALDKVWSSQKVNSENTALKAMVTDDYVFSPTKAYAAGDWLIHNNILYEVLVACTGVTPPNATYYDLITLHDLKNKIDALNRKSNSAVSKGVCAGSTIGGTIDNNTIIKVGNTVYAQARLLSIGGIANRTNCYPFIIPEGYRPGSDTYITIAWQCTGNAYKDIGNVFLNHSTGAVSFNWMIAEAEMPKLSSIYLLRASWSTI